MKRASWIRWIVASLLALALFAPMVGGIGAEDEEELAQPQDQMVDIADAEATVTPEESVGSGPSADESIDPAAATPDTSQDVAASDEGLQQVADEDVEGANSQEADISGSIKVFVEDQYGDPVPGAGLTVYLFENGACSATPVAGEQFTDANGIVIFLGLDPALTYCVSQTTVPPGYEGFPPSEPFIVTPSDVTEDVSPFDAVLYLGQNLLDDGELEAGKLTILKYYCEASGPEFQRVIFDLFYYDLDSVSAASESVLECQPGYAAFWIQPVGGDGGFLAETSVAGGSTVISGLEPGTYEITETVPWTSGTFLFEVLENGVTTIAVQNFLTEEDPGEGVLELQKYFCRSTSNWTKFILEDAVEAASQRCKPGQATFVIFPFFGGEPIELETDEHGHLILDEAPEGSHLLMEVDTEALFAFTIIDGETTSITVLNHFVPGKPGGEKPPADQPAGGEVAKTLPNTGLGTTRPDNQMVMLGSLAMLAALAGLRMTSRRSRI